MVASLREQLQEEKHCCRYYSRLSDRWQFEKEKLKAELCILVDYSYQPEFFNTLATGQKYLSVYLPSFFNIHRIITFPNFSR